MAIQELSAIASDTYIGGNFYMMWWNAGDSSHQCGYVVADDVTDDAEVVVCPITGKYPFGVGALQADVDIDTAFTENTVYSYYALHAGTVLRIAHDTSTEAKLKGQSFIRSDAVAGMVESGTTYGYLVGHAIKTYDVCADKYLELIT